MFVVRIQRNQSPWQAIAAFICFAGSALALLFGTLLTTSWLLSANIHPLLHALGLTLLIATVPILILGGHCLDLVESQKQ